MPHELGTYQMTVLDKPLCTLHICNFMNYVSSPLSQNFWGHEQKPTLPKRWVECMEWISL